MPSLKACRACLSTVFAFGTLLIALPLSAAEPPEVVAGPDSAVGICWCESGQLFFQDRVGDPHDRVPGGVWGFQQLVDGRVVATGLLHHGFVCLCGGGGYLLGDDSDRVVGGKLAHLLGRASNLCPNLEELGTDAIRQREVKSLHPNHVLVGTEHGVADDDASIVQPAVAIISGRHLERGR